MSSGAEYSHSIKTNPKPQDQSSGEHPYELDRPFRPPVCSCQCPCAHRHLCRSGSPTELLSACQLSPNRTNCDYGDPQATGCNNDAYNLAQADNLGVVRAVVRYSPSCKSAWARAVNLSNQPNTRITAQIARSTGGVTGRTEIYPYTAAVSNMLYIGDGSLAQATATLQNSYCQILDQARTGWAR